MAHESCIQHPNGAELPVAPGAVRVLLLCAKHLFVEATVVVLPGGQG